MKRRHARAGTSVLMVCPFSSPNVGGVESHLDDLLSALGRAGIEVTLITYTPLTTRARAPLRERRGRTAILRIPWVGRGLFYRLEKRPLLAFLYLFPLLYVGTLAHVLLRPRRYRAVHAHGLVAGAVAALLPWPGRRVFTLHAIYELPKRRAVARWAARILRRFDVVFALSDPSREEVSALPGVRARRYVYWLDLDLFRPHPRDEARKALGLPNGPLVLFVGRLFEAKGVRVALQAANEVKGATVVIVGPGPLASEVAAEPKVFFQPDAPREQLPLYYSAADVALVPSLYQEGFGRVAMEALACGTPVLATRVGGLPEVVTSDVGWLTEPAPEEILKSLGQVLAEVPPTREACRRSAEERFSERNAEVFIDAYDG